MLIEVHVRFSDTVSNMGALYIWGVDTYGTAGTHPQIFMKGGRPW